MLRLFLHLSKVKSALPGVVFQVLSNLTQWIFLEPFYLTPHLSILSAILTE